MKNYDYHRPAEKVLLDSYRKQNRNKNRLLFLAVALTVGVIFCMISFAYGKIQVDIQKHIRTDGMTVSTYIENGTEEMAGQLHTLSYIAETGKEKFAGKLCNQTIKYCDCVVADETAFETMLCPAYTQIVGTYPKQENEIMLSTKTLAYLGISEPKVGMELKLDFYWNDLFQTKGTGQQTFQLSGYFTEYQNQGASSSIAFLSEKKLKESGAGWNPCRILLKPEKDSVSGIQMEQQLQEDIRLKEAMEVLKSQPFDLVLLDINLPDGNGYEIAKTIRDKYSDTIVIFLTANDRESDEIRGYELGAVDYITKPFSIHSLQRKVENVLRMMRHHVSMQDVFDDGRLFLNFAEQTAMLGGKPLTLSTLEFRMLNLFCQNRNRVLTRKQLLEKIWDCTENYVDEHTLTTTLSRIRGKIETNGTVYIKTVYGMGYKWTGGEPA